MGIESLLTPFKKIDNAIASGHEKFRNALGKSHAEMQQYSIGVQGAALLAIGTTSLITGNIPMTFAAGLFGVMALKNRKNTPYADPKKSLNKVVRAGATVLPTYFLYEAASDIDVPLYAASSLSIATYLGAKSTEHYNSKNALEK